MNVDDRTEIAVVVTPLNCTDAPVRSVPPIMIVVPTEPEVGSKALIVGAGAVVVKYDAELACPPGVVTTILPIAKPAGTLAVIVVGETTVNAAPTPLNATPFVPVKVVPVIVTVVPTGPLAGVKDATVGVSWIAWKLVALVAVPAAVVTVIVPVVVPDGTIARK
jgi:hypothetical protein